MFVPQLCPHRLKATGGQGGVNAQERAPGRGTVQLLGLWVVPAGMSSRVPHDLISRWFHSQWQVLADNQDHLSFCRELPVAKQGSQPGQLPLSRDSHKAYKAEPRSQGMADTRGAVLGQALPLAPEGGWTTAEPPVPAGLPTAPLTIHLEIPPPQITWAGRPFSAQLLRCSPYADVTSGR